MQLAELPQYADCVVDHFHGLARTIDCPVFMLRIGIVDL
jgi:hypothetical protein